MHEYQRATLPTYDNTRRVLLETWRRIGIVKRAAANPLAGSGVFLIVGLRF